MTHSVAIVAVGALCGFGTYQGWEYVGWLWLFFVLVISLGATGHSDSRRTEEYKPLRRD